MDVALVTGGARRIGRAIVERLAREGFAVAIHYGRSRDEASALASRIEADGGRACIVQADLGDADAVARLLPEAAAALGPVTLLVNNASEFEPDSFDALDRELWDRHFAINLRAPVFLANALAQQLPEGAEGMVLNMIDQRVWKPTPLFASYQLTKSALFTATQTMAQAFAPRLRVNGIGPGPTLSNTRQADDDFRKQVESVPLQRGPSPEEIADTVVFLWRARSITGQMLAIDGGQHLAWETPDVAGITE